MAQRSLENWEGVIFLHIISICFKNLILTPTKYKLLFLYRNIRIPFANIILHGKIHPFAKSMHIIVNYK
jgi:hypothetical protein